MTVATNSSVTGIAGSTDGYAPLESPTFTGTVTVPTPAGDTDAATQAYVDNAILAEINKEAAIYATTAALATVVYANGSSGVGATLTGFAVGALSIDGASPSVGQRVLIKNQASTFENGIYTVTATGSGAAVFVLTRAVDFNQSADIRTGDTLLVTLGTVNTITTWGYTGIDAPTIGTTAITFVQTGAVGASLGANVFTGQQTFVETMDTVYTITDGAAFEIDPVNGNIQIVTLGAARTPAATNFAAGQCVILGIDDGTAYAVTWTTVAPVWVTNGGGGAAPTLAASGYTWIKLWKVGSVIYAENAQP